MSVSKLSDWKIPLTPRATKNWRGEYGIEALYLNDVAAGALLKIPSDWNADNAVERVASGLRHLLQELWHLDLVRPVLAVYTVADDASAETKNRLRRLTWDDEWHRGDFALRPAANMEQAAELLFTLMGDTMRELDEHARADRVGVPQARDAFAGRREELRSSQQPADQAEVRLIHRVLAELDRAEKTREEPRLVAALGDWINAEGGEQ